MTKESVEIEEYLEAIYRKKEKGEDAKTTDLAKELGVSPASVSEMIKKLARKGLVVFKPYRYARLTKKGEEIGRKITEKHRLIEKFLVLLGIKKNLHEEACELEHAVSDDVKNIMTKVVRENDIQKVSEMKKGDCGEIILIATGGITKKRLMEMGLTIGTRITVKRASRTMGAVEIHVRGTSLALGRAITEKIFVKKCEQDENTQNRPCW